jgi:CheY-like chemotaxis protein
MSPPDIIGDRAEDTEPRIKILVVEDDLLIRMTVSEYLRDCGLRVVEAANGQEAVKVLTDCKRPVTLVFSDIQMPYSDGFALARWIQTNRPGLCIILASGNPANAATASDMGLGPILHKPYDLNALHTRLQKEFT